MVEKSNLNGNRTYGTHSIYSAYKLAAGLVLTIGFLGGCITVGLPAEILEREQSHRQTLPAVSPTPEREAPLPMSSTPTTPITIAPDMTALIEQLNSPNFVEHTEAARKLVVLGPIVIQPLYASRARVREVYNNVLPFSLLLIQIIISRQDDTWLAEQSNYEIPQIREFILAEVAKRKEKNEEKKPTLLPNQDSASTV